MGKEEGQGRASGTVPRELELEVDVVVVPRGPAPLEADFRMGEA